jgi:hypothetical protein
MVDDTFILGRVKRRAACLPREDDCDVARNMLALMIFDIAVLVQVQYGSLVDVFTVSLPVVGCKMQERRRRLLGG